MRAGELIVSVDQGTSTTKVAAFDLDGRLVAGLSRETTVSHPRATWAEADPEAWWEAMATGIRDVLDRAGSRRVLGVGVCGLMHTPVLVDGQGSPCGPALLWADQRATGEVEELARWAGTVRQVTGHELSTMSWLPRLMWLGKHQPEAVARARFVLPAKDFLRSRLGGEVVTDDHDAGGTALWDVERRSWSEELLDLADVSPSLLPPVRRPDELAGVVDRRAAADTGLPEGTPVVVGTGDWPATLVGSGCWLPERTCCYLGTAGILGAFASAEAFEGLGPIHYFGSVTATGAALGWVRDLLFDAGPGCSQVTALAEQVEAGAGDLVFLPHLMGERGGGMRPWARGTVHGLTFRHGRAELARSVMEGALLWLREVSASYTEGHESGQLLLLGGLARSGLCRRICAAVFQRPVVVPSLLDGAAAGVAMLVVGAAATAPGAARSFDGYAELSKRWVRLESEQEPEPDLVEAYREVAARYRRVEAAMRTLEPA